MGGEKEKDLEEAPDWFSDELTLGEGGRQTQTRKSVGVESGNREKICGI